MTRASATTPRWGKYHEAYCVLYGLFEEKKVSRIPCIWVDSELSSSAGTSRAFPRSSATSS